MLNSNVDTSNLYSGNQVSMKQYLMKTFTTVAMGLFITAITAFALSYNYIGLRLSLNIPMFNLILMVAQLGVVISFSNRLRKSSLASARMMFIVYSMLTGLTFSVLQYLFEVETIFLAFGITAIYFLALVSIGYTTKVNLLRFGSIFTIGIICLFVFNLIAMFANFDGMTRIACSIGLLLFSGLTAYDVQKMKQFYIESQDNPDMLQRLSMYAALELYLDFINIFLYILRIVGDRD